MSAGSKDAEAAQWEQVCWRNRLRGSAIGSIFGRPKH
jgi:hypothetical protein